MVSRRSRRLESLVVALECRECEHEYHGAGSPWQVRVGGFLASTSVLYLRW